MMNIEQERKDFESQPHLSKLGAEWLDWISDENMYENYVVQTQFEGWIARAALSQPQGEPVAPDFLGMSVSVDVSTCDADSGNRYFGTVSEVMNSSDKHGVTLLVQDATANFTAPVLQGEPVAWLHGNGGATITAKGLAEQPEWVRKMWVESGATALIVAPPAPAQPVEQLYALLDKAASLLTESALSEDYEAEDALNLVAAIRGEFVDIGKTTVEHQSDVMWEQIRVAAGYGEDDEYSLRDALVKIAAKSAQPVPLSDEEIRDIGRKWVKEPGWYDFESNDFVSCTRAILATQEAVLSDIQCVIIANHIRDMKWVGVTADILAEQVRAIIAAQEAK